MAAPRSVRAKLLSAVVALLTLMFGSAILAISGFSRTGAAVTSLSSERLPDIVTASTLARESSALASLAPFVISVEVMAQLEAERLHVEAMISKLGEAVAALQGSDSFRGEDGTKMRALAATLSAAIRNLVDVSRMGLELRAEGVELQDGFERQDDVLRALDPAASPAMLLSFSRITGLLLAARLSNSLLQLDQLESDYARLVADLRPAPDAAAVRLVARFLEQQGSIFELRRSELEVQQRIRFLPASIQRMSEAQVTQDGSFAAVAAHMREAGMSVHELDGPPVDHTMSGLARADSPATCELRHSNGTIVEIRSEPMPEGGFVTIYVDQTERRAIEKQLLQAQRMEVVGQLTGGIAHDFNNFLASISSNLQILKEKLYDDPALSARVLRALDATERAASMTERLLAFSRQEALQPELTRVDELALNLSELLGGRLKPHINLELQLDGDCPPVFVDPGRLESAILNLMINARDALPAGEPVVVSVRARPEQEVLSVSVRDEGVGMSPEVLARIYEPFFTTETNGRGSGLDLSMVYGFITQSGGKILADSRPGAGTTVELRLPLRDPPPEMARPAGPEPEPRGALETGAFRVVLTDFLLPDGQTGLDISRLVSELRPGTPVLFTSGYIGDAPRQKLPFPPGVRLLRKPYRKQELAAALAAALAQRETSAPPGGPGA